MTTNWTKALDAVVSRTSLMRELREPMRRGEDVVASSGNSALIVYGRANLCDGAEVSDRVSQRIGHLLWGQTEAAPAELHREDLPAFDPTSPCGTCSGRGEITCEECRGRGCCCHCECGECPDCEGAGKYECGRCEGSGKQDPRRPEPVPGLITVPGGQLIAVDLARLELETRELPPVARAAVLPDAGGSAVLLLRGAGWAYILCRIGLVPTRKISLEPRLRDGNE